MADQVEGVLAPPTAQAETRPATVVKCDIVGSTTLNESLDFDGKRAFKRGWERLVTDVVQAHSGHIERFEGDGAFVTFGYPDAREDAAECAVRMALDLVDAVGAASFVPGRKLAVRIGIASGTVAVDSERGHPLSEALFGTTIDLAERLRAAAEPAQVVISDVTKRLAGRFFHYNDLGRMRLKGFGEPMIAWRVVRASSIASRFKAQRSASAAIVGRDVEMAQLLEAWSHVLAGKGMALCLYGEAGFGKSRLARAILDRAAADGAVVLEIDCTPSTLNTPLYPIGVLLRRLAGIGRNVDPAQARALAGALLDRYLPGEGRGALAYLAPLFGLEASAQPGTNPAELHGRTIAAVLEMLQHLAHDGPVALLCEDLQWADNTTAQAITRARSELDALRILLLVTTRPPEEDEALPLELSRFATIPLGKLETPVAGRMVRGIPRAAELDDATVDRIVKLAEGVPLVIEELAHNALEGLRDEPAAPHQAVPGGLDLVVHSRLARRPYLKPLVQAASILGREFSMRILEQMVPADLVANMTDTVATLVKDGLLSPADSGDDERMQFKHALIHEAVYATLLGSDAERLHSHAADTLLKEQHGTPDAAPDVVAEHLRLARRFAESIGVRGAAIEEMASRGAYVEAEGHWRAGLALLDEISDPNRRRVLEMMLHLRRGVAFNARFGYASRQAEAEFRAARELCREDDDVEFRYRISRGLAAFEIVRGNLPVAFELSRRSLEMAAESGRPEFRIDAMSVHSYATMYFRGVEDCRACIDDCLALYAREHGERLTYPVPNDAGTAALAIRPTIEWLRGDAEGCEAAIRDCLAHAEMLGRDFDRVYVHGWIAGVRCTQRRYAEALGHAAIAVEISERRMYREWGYTGKLLQLVALASLQPSDEVLGNAQLICKAFADEGVGLNGSWYLWGIARGFQKLGRRDEAAQFAAAGLARADASGESRMHPELLALQAEIEPDASRASELLIRAAAIAREHGAVANELRALAMLATRRGGTGPVAATARSTLEHLDGKLPYPPGRWMPERLDSLRQALSGSAVPA